MGVNKVAAFITRDPRGDAARRELLVFDHPNPLAGTQVPAGTVEPNEAVADAGLREAREETGLELLVPVGEPIEAPSDLVEGEWYLELNAGGRDVLEGLELAHPVVRIERSEGGRVLLSGARRDGAPAEWWDDRSIVTRDVRRWLFHFAAPDDTPDEWEHTFDTPDPWRFRWVPLAGPPPTLVPVQAGWLKVMRPRLEGD